MKKLLLIVVIFAGIAFLINPENAFGQSDLQKFEVGGQLSSRNIGFRDKGYESGGRWDVGGGGRFSFNLNEQLALESEVNFFPKNNRINPSGGKTQMLFGIKAGIRKEKFGVFGKLRPGIMRFTNVNDCTTDQRTSCGFQTKNEFALDAGGVLEFYPSKKTLIRFDAGNTLINFSPTYIVDINRFLQTRGGTNNYFQFSIGAGFRF